MAVPKRFLAVLMVASGMVGFLVDPAITQEPLPGNLPVRDLAPPGTASVSSGLPPPNQDLADAVARSLKQSSKLQRYRIDIQVDEGEVELEGKVSDPSQKEEALRLVRAVPGVLAIRDRLYVGTGGSILPVQGLPLPEQGPSPKKIDAPGGPPMGNLPPMAPPAGQAMPPEPTPISQIPPYDPLQQPPPMPPYAWPSYAPYNNLSRVAYPNLYPYESWPFIGPFYPFPKVPPGWRSVTLSWNDGFWWYGKNATGHDWWRIRYR